MYTGISDDGGDTHIFKLPSIQTHSKYDTNYFEPGVKLLEKLFI